MTQLNQLLRQTTEYNEHVIWGAFALGVAGLIISGIWAVAMYGLAKQVCVALSRLLHAKASVEEDEYRKRQVWRTSKQTPDVSTQSFDIKYRPKD